MSDQLDLNKLRAEVNEHAVLDIDQAVELLDELESLRTRFSAMRAGRDAERSRADKNANKLAQAEQAVERKQQALNTVARIVETQCEAVVLATDSKDLIGEDLDGDWDAVWDRLSDLADQKRDVVQAVGRVLKMLQDWGNDSDAKHYAVQLDLALSNGEASVAERIRRISDGAQNG